MTQAFLDDANDRWLFMTEAASPDAMTQYDATGNEFASCKLPVFIGPSGLNDAHDANLTFFQGKEQE